MIFRKKNEMTMEDKSLGFMKFHEDKKNPRDSYWECCRSVDFNIKNDNKGISTMQRNQVKLIEENLPGLMPQIQVFINNNAGRTYEIDSDIELSWIELENDDNQEIFWAIDFKFKKRWEHLVIEMKNWTPVSLSFWA